MKVSGKTILWTLLHLRARLGRTGLAQEYAGDEPPLRSELFSSEQMKRHDLVIPLVDDRQKHEVDLRIHIAHG